MPKEQKTPYTNREQSWVHFNERVLMEGLRPDIPLLERLKFLAIVSANLDEFYMVRVARLIREVKNDDTIRCPSGQRPSAILKQLTSHIRRIVQTQTQVMTEQIIPLLGKAWLQILQLDDCSRSQRDHLRTYFARQLFHLLTPLAVEPNTNLLSLLNNLRLHLAFLLEPSGTEENPPAEPKLAIVPIPEGLDRFYYLPSEPTQTIITPIENVIRLGAEQLFPGYTIKECTVFRVTRDADMSVDEERDEDFMEAMAEILLDREHSSAVRLEINREPANLRGELCRRLGLTSRDVYEIDGVLDLKAFMPLCFLPGFDHLRDRQWLPQQPQDIPDDCDLFEWLKDHDVLLHHPYESYEPVVRLINQAADDPGVLAIKMTLYRTSKNSPIIRALARAAENGKQVTALVELKARFDEEQNLGWAELLERAGVIVIYGIAHLKVHAKALLLIRKEADGIVRYFHMGTGNYNDSTAKLYTDMGLMSTREDLSYELALFFNAITGYSSVPSLRKLAMAPHSLKPRITSLVEREIERARKEGVGRIRAKMNALVDLDIIKLLYKASQAGVQIELNVRGICCLQPGIKGVSENIRVVSIIGRYLEHSRIFWFYNGGMPEVYLSSADWMSRNLSRRIELMFPIEDPQHLKRLDRVLNIFFTDHCSAHELLPDGSYQKFAPDTDQEKISSQERLYGFYIRRAESREENRKKEFEVRRKPPKRRKS